MANVFTLEALDAKQGDALLLHWGPQASPHLMVIDGGPRGVWNRSLKKRLQQLRNSRADPLPIDLVMVSHIDGDHINGILDLAAHLDEKDANGEALPYEIDEMWFNCFDDITGNVEIAAFTAPVDAAADAPLNRHTAATIAHVGHGRQLRDIANAWGVLVNGGDTLIVDGYEWDMGNGLSFHVIGPSETRLVEFQEEWDKKVTEEGWDASVAAAEIAAYLDTSAYNLASIVVLAKFGSKEMLLTGDARGDDIIVGLDAAGLLGSQGMSVDILKVPHHGSDRNVSTEFFKKVRAKHYIISGNGDYGNPDIATLEMILEARGNSSYTIHCTYRNGIKGHKARMDAFLAGLTASKRSKFSFRPTNALGLRVDLGAAI